MNEEWKKIYVEGVETDYSVSNSGHVRRDKTNRILKPAINKPNGYLGVLIYVGQKAFYRTIHRLVAEAFNIDYNKNLQVNHKNGIKHDNRSINLEWLTAKENVRHYFNVLKKKK